MTRPEAWPKEVWLKEDFCGWLWAKVQPQQEFVLLWMGLQATPTPTPEPSPTIIQAPPASTLEIVGAVVAIVFALAAGFLGYRIIRGGRGL
ncbi:MAG: hypothetical protein M3454_07635 [Actinomycetota bacterium]|nr:hypothetical protein [Actinomycetota bacterium]